MSKKTKTAISPTRDENYPEWFQQVIKNADLAELSSVRGCMVIKPWGYGIWELIQAGLDKAFKETGHQNIYCPLFIPVSLLEKEADHVDGFAKECAVVTHHRLQKDENGKLIPTDPLEEPLIVRPTSEAIIGEMFARWVQSYRDLPLLTNQWANVVRWEMRTRMFLRTTEFLWQEGHTVHATQEEALAESRKMLDVYQEFIEEKMAVPVFVGEKSSGERFPGADVTYCVEAMMQDKKALQAGTSHFLGQNFAKAFNIKFQNEKGEEVFAWTTSWGVTTRLIGAMIMVHSDDDGLICPPKIAPQQIIILPIAHKPEQKASVLKYCAELKTALAQQNLDGQPLRVTIDDKDTRPGEKNWSWVKKGAPIRIEVGAREQAEGQVTYTRRIDAYQDKKTVPLVDFINVVSTELSDIQVELFNRAKAYRDESVITVDNKEALYALYQGDENPGFAKGYFADDAANEEMLNQDLKISVRCILLDEAEEGQCILSGAKTNRIALFGKAY